MYFKQDAKSYRETKCVNFIRNRFINGFKCTGYWYCNNKTCDNRRYRRYKRVIPKRKENHQIKTIKCNKCKLEMHKQDCNFCVFYYKNTNILNSLDFNILAIRINDHADGCLKIPPQAAKAASRAFVCNF